MVKSQVIYKDYSKDAERTALVSGENLAHMFGKIARWYTDISWVGHTHTEANITDFGTYAGSSTKGGAATSANKLNIGASDIGSETKPVYFNATTGKPVACAYSLNASVPANAVFTDINVKQSPSTANESREVLFAGNTGNTETTGTVGKSNKLYFNPNTGALTATSFSGSVDASNLTGSIDAGRLPTTSVTAGSYGPAAGGTLSHGGTFDVGYVTVDKYGRLTGASTKTFTLPAQYVHPTYTSKTSGLYKITVDATGHVSGTAAVTAADLPAHTHDYVPNTQAGMITAINLLGTADGTPVDGTYYISQHNGSDGTNTNFYRRTHLALWNYIKGKADSEYAPKSHSHSYLPLSGGTLTGILTLPANLYNDNYALDCNNSNIIGANAIKFADNSDNANEGIMFYRSSTTWDSVWASSGVLYFTPNHPTSTTNYTVYHSGNLTYSTIGAAAASHTHNYAGSPTPGGDANRALQSNNCKVDVTNASTSTAYGVVFVKDPETTEDNTLRKTNDFRINHFRGAANTEGITELVLGNNVAKTSANNSSGHISFYNSNGKYTEIVPNTGSSGITITLPSSAGTLALVGDNNHTHNYIPNTQAGLIAAINLLSTGESTPTDNDYYIAQYAGGGTTNTSYHRRLHSALWSYINGKISYSNTGSGNAVTSISYSNGVIIATKGSTFASSTHTHGTLYDSFVTTLDTTTNTWAVAGLNGTGHVIKSIRTNTNAPAYLLNDFSAGIGFGGGDTRGVISVKYNTPIIRFAGGNRTAADGGTATWYFTLAATSAQTYTFPTTGGTLTDIIYKASNYYATASHTHSEYLPLAGGNMTGDISFASVTSTEYPAVSKQIAFSGSTDAASIFFEVTASDKGCLVLQTTDDADAKIVFRNKVTSGGTRANEVTITDGVIAGNGSGLTSLNASNISSGTLAEARLPKAYIPLAGSTAITGSLRATMGSTAGPFMSVSNGTYEIGLHVGTGGTNHGIFDFSSSVNAWMCYHDGTKNIFNGQANTAVTATKSTYTDHSPSITIQTGSSAQAKISLQTLINWLINTKKVLPTGVFIHKIIQSGWSYAANDILQLTCSGTNYEVQLAGVALEFIGTVSSYNAGEFRMMIHTSPTISFTVTSGYKAGPTSSTFVYTCNGSGYAPTWRLISNGLKYANGYWGLTDPSGGDADWTRTTSLGIIPYQSGGAGSGHQSLGTSSWYFLSAYIDTVYGSLSGNASSASMPYGFESRSSGAGWAAGGTFVTAWNAGNGCEIAFMKNYPASGQLSCCIDGYFFQNEGKKRVLDESNFSSYITPSSIGAAASSHSHTYIESKANYTFTSSTLPNSFDWGVSAGFVNSDSGFGSFGSVLTVRTYSGGGGTLQLYAPYSSTYGGTHLKARFGNYASSSGNSWTSLRELAWNDEKLGITTVTGSPDLDTYLTTGIYTINTSSAVHSPTTNYSTLFVDGSVGTPFQILKPDANDTTWYTRHRNNSAGTWYNWVALTLNGIPNTADGLSAAINLLSTGSSYPTDNDYYVTQYAGGGTSTVSYHRRPHSALWEYIRQKISNSGGFLGHTQIFSGSTAITAGKEKTIVTVTTDSGSQDARTYFVIRISWSSPSSDVTFIIPKKYNTWVNGVFAVNPGGGAPGTYNACVGIGVYFNRDSTGNTFKISFNTNTAFTLLRVDEYYC